MDNSIADVLILLLTIPALWLLGEKRRVCFLLFSVCNLAVMYLAWPAQQYGLVLSQVIYFVFNLVNYRKWNSQSHSA